MSKNSSEFKVQSSRFFLFRNPQSACTQRLRVLARVQGAIRISSGFTYISILVIIVVMGISLGAAGKYWSNVMLRENEDELLFCGGQYRLAIDRYYAAIPGRPQFPQTIEELLVDNRTPAGKRHLRRQFKDPMTSGDFVEMRDTASRRIVGVHSASEKAPLRQSGFSDANKDFEGKSRYADWQFIATVKTNPTATIRR